MEITALIRLHLDLLQQVEGPELRTGLVLLEDRVAVVVPLEPVYHTLVVQEPPGKVLLAEATMQALRAPILRVAAVVLVRLEPMEQ